MNILILDGHCLMHRARSGFQLGDFNVVFNLLRGLKPLVEKFKPNRVYFTLEGRPLRHKALLPEYKANRVIKDDDPKADRKRKSLEDFYRQMNVVVELLVKHFPISVVQHRDFEADDLIANLVENASRAVEFTVVSTDTDFIQLLQDYPNVKLYNPVTKKFLAPPTYPYVQWKALRGDGGDNISNLPGVGDKTAEAALDDPDKLRELLAEGDNASLFARNCELIQFHKWTSEEMAGMKSSEPARDWDAVKSKFEEWAFKSMLKEPYWEGFVAAFDALWL